jgi:uncharacterized membrane protein YbhN (UPF0104 family)
MSYTAVLNDPVNKKRFSLILRVLIITLVLYYLLTSVDFTSVYVKALGSDYYLILFALLLLPLNLLLQFYKWRLSCKYYLAEDNNNKIISSLFAGFSAAVFTPARIGEYAGRGIGLRDKKIKDIAIAVFADKMFTLLFVIIFGIAGAFYTLQAAHLQYSIPFVLIALTVIILIFFYEKIRAKFRLFKLPDSEFAIQMSYLSLLFYFCYLLQFVLLISAFTQKLDFTLYFAAAGLIMFIKTMIPNFLSGELGVRESASVFFLSYLGEDPASGLNASLFLFMINIVIPSALGLFPLLREKKND